MVDTWLGPPMTTVQYMTSGLVNDVSFHIILPMGQNQRRRYV